MIAQEGGGKVFDGVNGALSEHGFAVGQFHAHVERGEYFVAHAVTARHIDAAVEFQVIDGERGYFFHKWFQNVLG